MCGITIRNGYSLDNGGALLLHETMMQIIDCIFSNNYAEYFGGAAYLSDDASPHFQNCMFLDNTAYYYGQGGEFCAENYSRGGPPKSDSMLRWIPVLGGALENSSI